MSKVPNLPAFIKQFDFIGAKPNDGQDDKMWEQKNAWEWSVTMAIVRDCFLEFEKKVAIKGFPPEDTESRKLAETVQKILGYLLIRVVEKGGGDDDTEEKERQRQEEAWQIQLHTWMAMLNAGPGSSHLILMKDVFDRDIKDFFQSRNKQQIASMLTLLKRDFVKDECKEEEYARLLRFAVQPILENYTQEQKRAVHAETLDLYLYYLSGIQHCLPKIGSTVVDLCRNMEDDYEDHNIFMGIKSADVLKQTLESLKQLVLSDSYHDNESRTHGMTNRAMEYCLKAVIAEQDGVTLLREMFDFLMKTMLEICRNEKCRESKDAMDIWSFRFFAKLKMEPTEAMFDSCIAALIELMALRPVGPYLEEVIDRGYRQILAPYPKPSQSQAPIRLKWCLAALKTGRYCLADNVRAMIDNDKIKKAKVFQWKNCLEDVKKMLEAVGEMRQEEFQDDKKQRLSRTVDQYSKVLKELLTQIRHARVLPQITSNIVDCSLKCLEVDPASKCDIAEELTDRELVDLQKQQQLIPDILRRLLKLLQTDDYPWDDTDAARATNNLVNRCIDAFSNGRQVSEECNQLFLDIFLKCMEGEDEDRFYQAEHPDRHTIFFDILRDISSYTSLHQQSNSMDVVIPLVPELLKWCQIVTDNEDLLSVFMSCLQWIGMCAPAGLKDSLPQLLEVCLEQDSFSQLYSMLTALYKVNPEPVHARIPDLFQKIPMSSESDRHMIHTILYEVAQKHPEVFTKEQVGSLLESCRTDTVPGISLILVIMRSISEKVPERLAPFFSLVTDDSVFLSETLNLRSGIISCIGQVNEELCQRAVDYLIKHVEDKNPTTSLIVVTTLRTMIQGNEKRFEKHKDRLEQLEKSTMNPTIAESCHGMILAIEGKNVEGLFDDLKEQQEDIDNLDDRVTGAEGTINVIGVKVDDQGREIKDVKKDVVKVEKRVDEVEEDLGDTKIKVEEIDNKTMTNAPKWSQDLTKLMNPVAENDWRLLAKRLGYSNDDIRGWATQHDPCMALLSEWYAVRKTSEASRAVYTALEEMDRMDGLAIVENAMKAAEGVVENEEFEYASPPPIFLSYQWGMQEEVKLLNKHLNMAGYQCWMDIGQMGGGDKLFAKIDNGIRAAKLIICCTTEKYAKSPNCNREVNLSVSLGKPIIPLLMEKMDWPPKGSMGPIFSEYLFIRFFQRGGEETKDQRYWPVPKFQELLMQLNFNKVMPEEGKISKEYQNWWAPVEDVIVIDKNKKKQGTSTAPAEQKKDGGEESSPDVFLSYQWGKQPQLKELYKRLTGMGYTCWMDIYQMGGGDSLYDKIDRGMRGCKVVVTCVTPKYALSANCRREVSLADALKKPIVPLLLDQMTWPPDGPMSMVFTQLLYINFYRNQDDQMQWKSPQFKEMVDQISQHLPAIESGKSDDSAQKNNPTATPGKKPNASENKPKAAEHKPKAPVSKPKSPEHKPKSPEHKPKAAEKKANSAGNKPKASLASKSAVLAASTMKTQGKQGSDKSKQEDKKALRPSSEGKPGPDSKKVSKDDEYKIDQESSAARQSFMIRYQMGAQASYPSEHRQIPQEKEIKQNTRDGYPKTGSEDQSQSSKPSEKPKPTEEKAESKGKDEKPATKSKSCLIL